MVSKLKSLLKFKTKPPNVQKFAAQIHKAIREPSEQYFNIPDKLTLSI